MSDEPLSEAEQQLLTLLRGQDVAEFDVRVSVRDGRWFVSLGYPALQDKRLGNGEGDNFADAWNDVQPPWAEDVPD
jgi:hypothetical protein